MFCKESKFFLEKRYKISSNKVSVDGILIHHPKYFHQNWFELFFMATKIEKINSLF